MGNGPTPFSEAGERRVATALHKIQPLKIQPLTAVKNAKNPVIMAISVGPITPAAIGLTCLNFPFSETILTSRYA